MHFTSVARKYMISSTYSVNDSYMQKARRRRIILKVKRTFHPLNYTPEIFSLR